MTADVRHFHCSKCKAVTPHEMNQDWTKARCAECAARQRNLALHEDQFSPTNRHISALDGMGNRGEPPPRGRKDDDK